MKARIDWHGGILEVDFSLGRSLAISIDPRGKNPNFFAEAAARAEPLRCGGFVGDMAGGGSCNAEVIQFSTHSHGTHTECVGHISPERQAVTGTIEQRPTLMRLVTIAGDVLEGDQFIPARALADLDQFDGSAVAIRTLPNDVEKLHRDYDETPGFPVLTSEAMTRLSKQRLMHLLIDTPSVDHPDNQVLENHATWWGLDARVLPGVPNPAARSITEMIYVPDEIEDGDYWLDLQLAPLVSDAVPSRPVIYPLTRVQGGGW